MPESESNVQPEMLTLAQPNEYKLEIIEEKDMFQMPSTSQNNPTMVTVDVHNSANESNPCLAAGIIQNESAYTNSNVAPDETDASNVCITPIENIGSTKRQRKPKYGGNDQTEQIYSVEIKPKRVRTTKPKTNAIKIEQPPSLPLLLDDVPSGSAIPSPSQQKVQVQKAKRKSTVQIKKNAVESKVSEEMKLKTSQVDPTIVTTTEHSIANESVVTNSVHTNELNSNCITETAQLEAAVAGNPSENADKQQPNAPAKGNGNVEPAKRQRRSKYDSFVKPVQNENVETKPKRGRASKPKANLIQIEQSSSQLSVNDVVTGKYKTLILHKCRKKIFLYLFSFFSFLL